MPRLRTASALLLAAVSAACGGGGGGGGSGGVVAAPASVGYATASASYRVGVAVLPDLPTVVGGTPTSWTVAPALPPGVLLDASTGAVTGMPTAAAATATYVVTASNAGGSARASLSIQVAPALPAGMTSLADGFQATRWLADLAVPAKIAFAPDGRLFFSELQTGRIRVHDGASLLPAPFATLPVLTGAEQGLLGIAIAPDFSTSGHLYVFASTPADAQAGKPDRNRVVRFTASGNVGTAPTVIVDDLPIGAVRNAGDVEIGPDGDLYVSIGDNGDQSLSQTDGVLAGRVLRYTATGAIPADNPSPGSPEWCRGLRNPFDLTFHPGTGGLFASENGPTEQDEIDFLQPGKDYGWPVPLSGGSTSGFRVTQWTPVIAPTGIVFQTGGGFGPEYDDSLFVGGYVDGDVRRLALSGPARTDLDAELPFLSFSTVGGMQRPLDLAKGPDGALYVSTFDSIWRISRAP